MIENRKVERFDLNLAVKLSIGDTVLDNICTEDISSGGMFITTKTPLTIGTKVGVDFFLPFVGPNKGKRKNMLSVDGKVVRTERRGLAIKFDHGCKFN